MSVEFLLTSLVVVLIPDAVSPASSAHSLLDA